MFHDWTRRMNLTFCKKCMMVKSKKNEFGICSRAERRGFPVMTYPDDIIKAAREAAAKAQDELAADARAKKSLFIEKRHRAAAESFRRGERDQDFSVRALCIAIMAEREHWTDFAKEQVKRASEDGYRIGQLEGELAQAAEKFLKRAECLIAKGKDLPFKPSFGMLVIEWMRQIQREGKSD